MCLDLLKICNNQIEYIGNKTKFWFPKDILKLQNNKEF